jgi:hypothetical protein
VWKYHVSFLLVLSRIVFAPWKLFFSWRSLIKPFLDILVRLPSARRKLIANLMHVEAGQIVDRPMCFLIVFVAVLDMLATKTLLKESRSGAGRTRTISSFTLSGAKTAEFQTQEAGITVNERPCTSRSDTLCEHGGK